MSMFRRAMMAAATASAPPVLTLPTTNLLDAWTASDALESGGALTSWPGVNGNTATLATGGGTPTVHASVAGLGGRPAVELTHAQWLEILTLASSSTSYTIFCVSDVVALRAGYNTVFRGGGLRLYQGGSTGQLLEVLNGSVRTLGIDADVGVRPMVSTWQTGSGGTKGWINRVLQGTNSGANTAITAGTATIGLSNGTSSAAIKLGTLAIYEGVLSDSARAEVWDALHAYYGIDPSIAQGTDTPRAYDAILVIGQSNAKGHAPAADLTAPYDTPDPNIRFFTSVRPDYRDQRWGALRVVPDSDDWGWGPEQSAARDLAADAGWDDDLRAFKVARGGTSLAVDWVPSSGNMWIEMLTVYNRAVSLLPNAGDTLNIRAILWVQGEADASNPTWASNYETNLTAFIAALRAQFGASIPFWMVALGTSLPSPYDYTANVNAAMTAVATTVPGVYLLPALESYESDGIHGDAPALLTAGHNMAASAIAEGA